MYIGLRICIILLTGLIIKYGTRNFYICNASRTKFLVLKFLIFNFKFGLSDQKTTSFSFNSYRLNFLNLKLVYLRSGKFSIREINEIKRRACSRKTIHETISLSWLRHLARFNYASFFLLDFYKQFIQS